MQDFNAAISPFEHQAGQLVTGTDKMLLGMRTPADRAAGMDLRRNGDHPGDPARPRVIFWQHQERDVPFPDEFHQHQGWFERPAFRGGNGNNIARHDTLAEFFRGCLYAEGELILCPADKQKGVISPDEQKRVLKGVVHAADTSSDWQLGQMGFLPMPLNRSPHSLHR
jgi:hypothetical protein